MNSLRAQQLRKDEIEGGAHDGTPESMDDSMDTSSSYEGSPTPSSAQFSP